MIGICACYDNKNYGSMLQTYATQEAILKLGFDCEFIDYKKKITLFYLIKQFPRIFNSNLIYEKKMKYAKKIKLNMHKELSVFLEIRNRKFQVFKDKYYKKVSPKYLGYENLKKEASKYDSVLVGSDQLWIPAGLGSNFYNLMFVADNVNKISYATSFGVSDIPWYQKRRTKKFLDRINYLSVRENSGLNICNSLGVNTCKVVLDPTLLFNQNERIDLIPNRKVVDYKYVFCYFLGTNTDHRKVAKSFAKSKNLKIIALPFLDNFVEEDLTFADENLYDVGPDDFVNLIRNAEYIITDSFHGTVFSILNHKKFITLNRFNESKQSRNSRIDSILSNLALSERREIKNIDKDIDYNIVEEKLSFLRNDSLSFLKRALNKE